ncbi:MAG: hypothetical protein NTZ34_10870 [Chloroflexi bacterium]|nr:hypothetical protein [Chloroflexota bacterium]
MMKISTYKLIPVAIVFIVISALVTGCVPVTVPVTQTQEPPNTTVSTAPQFTFMPIQVSPLPVITGKTFTITMKVSNAGTAAGTYKADLYIDGSLVNSQAVTVNPGQSADTTFQSTLQVPGHHIIGIGQQTLDVTVTDSRIPVSIKIGNGQMDGCDPAAESVSQVSAVTVQGDGNMIKLTAPQGGFTITGIKITGYIKDSTYDFNRDPVIGGAGQWVYGADIAQAEPYRPDFSVNIYGDHRNKLYSGNYNKSLFTTTTSTVTLPVPDIRVGGDFYIEVLPYNLPRLNASTVWDQDYWHRYVVHTWYYQLCIGYESAMEVQSWVSEGGSIVPDHYLTYNWLIQAEGYQTGN